MKPKIEPEKFFSSRASLYSARKNTMPLQSPSLKSLDPIESDAKIAEFANKRVEKTFVKFINDNHQRHSYISKIGKKLH